MHSTITQASFIASASFHLSAATLISGSQLSQHLLSALDAVLGSTESSKAIAAIITLIRREFKNPATGVSGERLSVSDLLVGSCGFALLQRWGKKKTEQEMMERNGEIVVWDVVILGDGSRADVVESQLLGSASRRTGTAARTLKRPSSFMSTGGENETFDAIRRDGPEHGTKSVALSLGQGNMISETSLQSHILRQLPADARVSIHSDTVTTTTVTVEIFSPSLPVVEPPPGVSVLREEYQVDSDDQSRATGKGDSTSESDTTNLSRYKVVYQAIANRFRSTNLDPRGAPTSPSTVDEDHDTDVSTPPRLRVSASTSPEPEEPPSPAYKRVHRAEASRTDLASNSGLKEIKDQRPYTPEQQSSNSANQTRQRKPLTSSPVHQSDKPGGQILSLKYTQRPKQASDEKTEKKISSRKTLKKKELPPKLVGPHKTNSATPSTSNTLDVKQDRPPWRLNTKTHDRPQPRGSTKPSNYLDTKSLPEPPQRGNPNFFSSRDLGQKTERPGLSSRASYYSIHETRRDSLVSQTDMYSVHSIEQGRSTSPNRAKIETRTQSGFSRCKSDMEITQHNMDEPPATSSTRRHSRSKSFAPSIYTLATNDSQTSLVLSNPRWRSIYDESSAIPSLSRDGHVPGLFPRAHFVRNLARFARFSSASYGSSFLHMMGIASASPSPRELDLVHHHEHHSFSSHTGLPPSTILLSSFVDPQGGTNAAGETGTNVPLVHYVSLDHESKAVVLTCRGTLGFEDILTDLTCDYDNLTWRNRAYQVHKGMHASARRLMQGGGGRVMATIKAALEEFDDYGLVMCGHSLGGGVAAILAILLSEPDLTSSSGTSFITATIAPVPLLLPSISTTPEPPPHPPPITLPPNRPIHVYAYGPPATISPSLRRATRGLITTIVNGQDVVPTLSLGILHDFQAVALAFKTDTTGVKDEFRKRIWNGLLSNFTTRFGNPWSASDHAAVDVEDHWPWAALKSLRASMQNPKLFPPGEVFVVETTPVLQRDAFTARDGAGTYAGLGRRATRVRLKYIRDVERKFGEIGFGGGMLGDHSPGRYEGSLGKLGTGVLG